MLRHWISVCEDNSKVTLYINQYMQNELAVLYIAQTCQSAKKTALAKKNNYLR